MRAKCQKHIKPIYSSVALWYAEGQRIESARLKIILI